MPDDIDIQQLEKAEKELEKQLAYEAHDSPVCPACGSPKTTRIKSLVTINIVAITFAQFIFFMYFKIYGAIIAWFPLPLLSLFALYSWIYTPNYFCSQCGQRFQTKLKRYFT